MRALGIGPDESEIKAYDPVGNWLNAAANPESITKSTNFGRDG